ncbi:MAG: superoxide dismutase [Candidatus Pseudobacter hemicellulosilyticus]|uniref:Superoxide dismutase n=1 Tax=Candidatus Pseudobacter hemicellulosilyticus TaxID=3121375 RepID=A0AAJ5WTS8_9BACT|nr:MAG: superoxide dismutase [Pseudobacter sp.]
MKKNSVNRRQFISTTAKAGITVGMSLSAIEIFAKGCDNAPDNTNLENTPYEQTPLGYAYNALEPVIDAQTMEIHYTKHAAAYAKALGEATAAENVDKTKTSVEQLLGNISKYSTKMRNNAGGHYNHELFWKLLSPATQGNKPSDKLMAAINKDFTSFDNFKTQFADAGKSRFGSGWAWLVAGNDKKLSITSTPNQDNPLMDVKEVEVKGLPLLGLDVWEHAYYLKYQNKRPDYITAFWDVINWGLVEKRWASIK